MSEALKKRADKLLDKLLDHNLQFDAQTGAAQIVDDLMAELQQAREERTAWRVTAENAEAELAALRASLGEPVAWDVYVEKLDKGYLIDDLDDPEYVDDATNYEIAVIPLFAIKDTK